MKRLLLLIVPLLLLVGVSFAWSETFVTFTYTWASASTTTTKTAWHNFAIAWNTWTTFYSFRIPRRSTQTCTNRWLYQQSWNVLLTSWTINVSSGNANAVSYPNYYLSPWVYRLLEFGNSWLTWTCTICGMSTPDYATKLFSWFLHIWCLVNWQTTSCDIWWFSAGYAITDRTFTWTDPLNPTPSPINIRYNWTSTGTTDSNVYLMPTWYTVWLSGTSLLFTWAGAGGSCTIYYNGISTWGTASVYLLGYQIGVSFSWAFQQFKMQSLARFILQ